MKLSKEDMELLQLIRKLNEEGKKLLWEYVTELEKSSLLDKPDIIENKKER